MIRFCGPILPDCWQQGKFVGDALVVTKRQPQRPTPGVFASFFPHTLSSVVRIGKSSFSRSRDHTLYLYLYPCITSQQETSAPFNDALDFGRMSMLSTVNPSRTRGDNDSQFSSIRIGTIGDFVSQGALVKPRNKGD